MIDENFAFFPQKIFVVSRIILIFACENLLYIIMKKKDENKEELGIMASEPVGASKRADVSTLGYDIDNWPGMPLVGPSNLEDMNARIDQAEQEIDKGLGFSWEQVLLEAQSIVSRYESTVY